MIYSTELYNPKKASKMSRRSQLEHLVSVAQERIKKAPEDTPMDVRKMWEKELVSLEFELNNLFDGEEDNNE